MISKHDIKKELPFKNITLDETKNNTNLNKFIDVLLECTCTI